MPRKTARNDDDSLVRLCPKALTGSIMGSLIGTETSMTTGAEIVRYEVPLPAGASRTAIEAALHAAAERLGFGAGLATIVVKKIVSQVGVWLVEVTVYGRALAFICNLRVECLKPKLLIAPWPGRKPTSRTRSSGTVNVAASHV